jgi:EmrB/QacA subfamily drug resistance transporter
MVVGFFMILVDATIVAVANFKIMAALDIGFDTVLWVTSAYLVAYAVPLLVAGRLGDRFGPKNVYLIGLAVFTAASLWCGLSGSIGMLITARVVQGIGAALLTPQTLTMITRIFPPERRGVAMSVWGATAGVATLVGPLAGGVLADSLGWEWIFFINVPVGIVGLVLALRLIPALPVHAHRFDLIGVALSGVGVFLIVFALQEGQAGDWQPWIWAVIVAGIGCLVMFGYWQSINRHEPLVPLHIFGDRDFCLSNIGIAVIGFMSVAMMFPVMFYAQGVCGLSPTRSALLTAPMPIAGAVFAPLVGKIIDRSPPRPVVGFGFSTSAVALAWLSIEMTPTTPIWRLVLPLSAMGVGMAFIWSPLGATATRNLSPHSAGAGSGVFNATRQLGTVLGSAGMAAFMSWRLSAEMPHLPDGGNPQGPGAQALQLPAFLREPFSAAMSESILLPAFIALFGVLAALFLVGGLASAGRPQAAATVDGSEGSTGPILPSAGYNDARWAEPTPAYEEEGDTEPLAVSAGHVGATAAAAGHADPLRPWPGPVPEPVDEPIPGPEPELIGFAHNGFHVDDEQRFRPLTEASPPPAFEPGRPAARHRRADPADDEPSPGGPDGVDSDAASYGRHSRRDG